MMKDDFILVQLWGSHVLCSRTEQAESLQLLQFLTLYLKGHLPQNLVMWEGRVGYESCEKSFPIL